MEPTAFCTQANVLVVAGKGGVGKTTVAATLALMAARAGLRALIVEVEGTNALAPLFGHPGPLTYEEVVLYETPGPEDGPGGDGDPASGRRPGLRGPRPGRGSVRARTLTPDDALVEYLDDHGMRRISRRLASTGTLDVVATAVPGIKDILVLGKVKQLERAAAAGAAGAPEVIVVDAPAAGHAIQFLASARGLIDAVAAGPIRAQAADVDALLSDPARCQVVLVTVPEETPVNEVVETAFGLEDRSGVQLAPVVVNAVLPPVALADPATLGLSPEAAAALGAAADFRRRRQALQAEQLERLAERLPLPRVRLPFIFGGEIGPAEVEHLAAALAAEVHALSPSSLP